MNEKIKNEDPKVLLTADGNGKVKAVSGMGEDGKLKTVEPTKANLGKMLEYDKNGNLLENFFKKFMEQAKDPSHTGLYAVSAKAVDKMALFFEKIISVKADDNVLKLYRVDPATELAPKQEQEQQPTQRFQPFDLNKMDWNEVDKLGLKAEDLQDSLKSMSYGYLSPNLVTIEPEIDGQKTVMDARLSLTEQPDGSLKLNLHPYQQEPDFDKPFQGVLFTERDIEQFKANGHGGRVFELEPVQGGEKIPSLVSLDPKTNRFEAVPLDSIHIGQTLKGKELTPDEQNALRNGKSVWLTDMDKNVKPGQEPQKIDRFVQYNAVKRGFDFMFSPEQRQAYDHRQKQDTPEEKSLKARKVGEVWVRPKQGGVELTKEQFEKICNKEAVFIKDMTPQKPKQETAGAQKVEATDGKGQKYDAWVWIDDSKGHVRHTSKTPEQVRAIEAKKAAQDGQNIKPAAGFETQQAVNSQGKTNEATKHSTEPLKKGQMQPTEKQAEKKEQQQSPAKPRKSAGHKI